MTDERIRRPNYSSDLMKCSKCGETYDELFKECPKCNPPETMTDGQVVFDPLAPFDELAKRVERLENHMMKQDETVVEINKTVLDELRLINHDIMKVRMDMQRLGKEIDELKEG